MTHIRPFMPVITKLVLNSKGSAVLSTSPTHVYRYPSPPSSPPSSPPDPVIIPQPKTCKMLLVGLRHSGKTTIIKQLKYLYGNWAKDLYELKRFIPDLLERCIVAMKASLRMISKREREPTFVWPDGFLLEAAGDAVRSTTDASLKEAIRRIEEQPARASVWSSELSALMRRIWGNSSMQRALLEAIMDEDDV